jgi:hypothetical protein
VWTRTPVARDSNCAKMAGRRWTCQDRRPEWLPRALTKQKKMLSLKDSSSPSPAHRATELPGILRIFLIGLVLVGLYFRFVSVNWSQGTNLHPDEYGLTNTLTQLKLPSTLGEYFNTRLSPISPYQKYDAQGNPTENGPDNRMRWGQWPIILIRAAGELTGNIGYDEIRLLGRRMSAVADSIALLLIFLIGRRLFNTSIGLTAAALSSLAVMQIQQSHFMTVDNFGVLFSCVAMYSAVRIAQGMPILRPETQGDEDGSLSPEYVIHRSAWLWYAIFGVAFGMAVASRVNLLPLGGMVLVATFIAVADLKLRSERDLSQIAQSAALLVAFSLVVTAVTFRVTQPMTFRARTGDTSILTLTPNSDWVESMIVAQHESNGTAGGPPSEQWANRTAIIFPLMNMVVWGMGFPLGLAAWAGFAWAAWRVVRQGREWRLHLLQLVWVGGYFGFMGTRWVKSVRYFLPIYPFLCLLAAWALIELWRNHKRLDENGDEEDSGPARRGLRQGLGMLAYTVVTIGTLTWAYAFVKAVYLQDHTRIQASRWIYENIPTGSVISNESWDEGLPLSIPGFDSPGQLYRGITMEVRWFDDEHKKEMFLENLPVVDYIFLPSQRAIWSTSRIPKTYPMTIEYYRALFDGRLGFDLVAMFTSPFKIGPLEISDVGGTIAWGHTPTIPVFDGNFFGAEEAFSVYDHPPVWIFKKRADFDINNARAILDSVDLSKVVIQNAREASR